LPDRSDPSAPYRLSSLLDRGALAQLAIIGVIVLFVVGCFAYVGGWLSPRALTQARMIDAFERANGDHPGFRRNHAKGLCIGGFFESSGRGARLSRAMIFQPGRTPVVGRFALAGGQPALADNPAAVRSMALALRPPRAEEWRVAMNDTPVFAVSTPESFYEQLVAARPDPATGKPDPAKMQAFLAGHPETVRALQAIAAKPFSTGFANADYNSLDAFLFVDAGGAATPVRWSMAALEPFEPETRDQAASPDKDYLFEALIARVARGPLQWRLLVTIGNSNDPTNDATIAWPDDRERVDVGTLTIDRVEGEAPGDCRDINFDPLVLPSGIAPSDDPLLSARSAAYSESFTRRAGESKSPSAVQPPRADKGS
jgi:catalase